MEDVQWGVNLKNYEFSKNFYLPLSYPGLGSLQRSEVWKLDRMPARPVVFGILIFHGCCHTVYSCKVNKDSWTY